jgi:hypothetical protein
MNVELFPCVQFPVRRYRTAPSQGSGAGGSSASSELLGGAAEELLGAIEDGNVTAKVTLSGLSYRMHSWCEPLHPRFRYLCTNLRCFWC